MEKWSRTSLTTLRWQTAMKVSSDHFAGWACDWTPTSSTAWFFCERISKPKLAPQKFQHQAHDHVLKAKERRHNAFARACHYLLENPLRAGLVKHPAEWPFGGAIVLGYPTLHPLQDDFWPKFWKLYARIKHPDAGNIIRPPIS